ncbi:MAG: AAA family ATPase [Oscillospiraceae bacterium]|nr:AAA family ATPase [Oscillospiraceae bacterium]
MRFESIKIHNYRQYRDLNFDFSLNGANDIHLVIATNGTGKTNLLNAINWCLYGDEPHTSGAAVEGEEKADKLPLANIQSLSECRNNKDTVCMVSVVIEATDAGSKYTFTRTANISVETELQAGKDKFEIGITAADGITKFCDGDAANEIISEKMPRKIREYFFFDGEQLLNYFGITGTNVSHLRDSIYEIAQVNIIDKSVIENLESFIKKFQKKIKELSPITNSIADEIDTIQKNIDSKEKEINTLTEQIAMAEEEIDKCNQLIKNTDTVVEDNKRFEGNKAEIKDKEAELITIKKDLAKFIRQYLVKIMLRDVNSRTNEYIEMRQNDNDVSPVADIDILKKSIQTHKCAVCGENLAQATEHHFQELIQKYDSNISLQRLVEIKNDVRRGLDVSEYESAKKALFDRLNKASEKIRKLQEENEVLFKRISTVTGIEEIEAATHQREDNEKLRDSNREKIGKYKEQLESMRKKLQEKNKEYSDALAANQACKEIREKYEFVQRAKDLLVKIKNGIVTDITTQLESKTMELFDALIWKKGTYGRVELDANFRLKLYHKITMSSCLNSCSAAEKELLALAFTLAVHEVSGYDNLLFIDTPVGRVSDENRENFAQVLLDISKKKQIILAFTPSEYSEEIKSVLNDSTASTVSKLVTDEITTEMR